jgi:pilus assembly protein CpaF
LKDGTRKVVQVTEVQGMEGDTFILQDLFMFKQVGFKDGHATGSLVTTGLRPKFAEKFASNNIPLAENMFDPGQ